MPLNNTNMEDKIEYLKFNLNNLYCDLSDLGEASAYTKSSRTKVITLLHEVFTEDELYALKRALT